MLTKFMPAKIATVKVCINSLICFLDKLNGMSVFYRGMKPQAKFLDLHFLWKERKKCCIQRKIIIIIKNMNTCRKIFDIIDCLASTM